MSLWIGLDSGTQGVKGIVLDDGAPDSCDINSLICASSSVPHPTPMGDHGRREQNPQDWINAVQEVILRLLNDARVDPSAVRGIGVSAQQHGAVFLDSSDRPLRPAKLWCDTETVRECEDLMDRVGGAQCVQDLIGQNLAVGYTASKILWTKMHEPEIFDRIHSILLPHDMINFWLTGNKTTEAGDASGTGYFDSRERVWSHKMLQSISSDRDLLQCLPKLVGPREPAGTLRPSLAHAWGLNERVIVSSGGGDNMMAAIGTGTVSPGRMTVSLGTSGTLFAFSTTPLAGGAHQEIANFCSSDGHWLPLVCTMNCTVATEYARRLFGMDLLRFDRLVNSVPIGSDGLVMLPFFNGERTPARPRARASLHGMTEKNATQEHFCRASMEAASFGLRYGLELFRQSGIQTDRVRLVGGGSRSLSWRRMIAGLFNCPVEIPETPESGALGAALQAIWCVSRGVQTHSSHAELTALTETFVRINEAATEFPRHDEVTAFESAFALYMQFLDALDT